jgi:hypothetical protein
MVPGVEGAAVEIITTRPLSPRILFLPEPARLVIDLPDTHIWLPKKLDFRSDQVNGVRIDQFQKTPPVARIVLDLARPVAYSWDAAGNRLMVRLQSMERDLAPATSTQGYSAGIATMLPSGAGKSTAMVQTSAANPGGSSVSAGADTAILRLSRGGEVRVCPGTTVSVTYSQSGQDLMLGMNTGAIEGHYSLPNSSDTVMTPDFRIQMAGPGEFHYAISADARGNTCVRTLPGNNAPAMVSELFGNQSYQVMSSGEVVFHSGHIAEMSTDVPPDCGCPATATPVLRTSAMPGPSSAAPASSSAPGTAPQVSGPETAGLPAPSPNAVHVQVDAPFVFRATDPPPAPVEQVAELRVDHTPPMTPVEITVLPPGGRQAAPKPNTGFFGKIKGFFAAIFR